jgi:hypothetical protein
MLTDAGPLLAILDRGDAHHAACMGAAGSLGRAPLLTTWPCVTEAMHLHGRAGGYRLQSGLWNMRTAGRLVVHDLTGGEVDRIASLMHRYQDTPMDLGDASLIAVAESRSLRQVFTFDRHFWTYRLADGSALELIPARP